jgi:hypothetical protein
MLMKRWVDDLDGQRSPKVTPPDPHGMNSDDR